MFVDADAHVDESTATWSYFPKSMAELRPVEMDFVPDDRPPYVDQLARGLFIDGNVFLRRNRNDELTQTTRATRELEDVPGRLRHMDQLNVESQVLYPSTLLSEMTDRPELEIAIYESYNRWIADRCTSSDGRLRWNAILPLRTMPAALAEMRRAKDAGAVGIFKRPYDTHHRRAGDRYFDPMYELAQELDLPICFHTSGPFIGYTKSLSRLQLTIEHQLYVQDAFLSLLESKVPSRFSRLRFVFVEAASGWLPYVLWMSQIESLPSSTNDLGYTIRENFERVMTDNRLYVTCEPREDLVDIVGHVGDECLCVGTDYSHSDRAALIRAHETIGARGDLSAVTVSRLTEHNARRLYGIAPHR